MKNSIQVGHERVQGRDGGGVGGGDLGVFGGFELVEAEVAEVGGGGLESVEEEGGAAHLDVAGGEGAEDVGDGDLDGGGVLEEREVEGFEDLGFEFGRELLVVVGVAGVAGLAEVAATVEVALVVVAEALAGEGGGAAEGAVLADVRAGGVGRISSHRYQATGNR